MWFGCARKHGFFCEFVTLCCRSGRQVRVLYIDSYGICFIFAEGANYHAGYDMCKIKGCMNEWSVSLNVYF